MGLNTCWFWSSPDATSSLPTHLNRSAMKSCSDVATSHLTASLWTNPMSIDCIVAHILLTSTSSSKTAVWPSDPSSLQLQVPYWFAQTQAPLWYPYYKCLGKCSFFNLMLKIMALWQLSAININGILTFEEVDMLYELQFIWLLMISDTYYKHVNLRCILCTGTGGLYKHWQQLPFGIFSTMFSKALIATSMRSMLNLHLFLFHLQFPCNIDFSLYFYLDHFCFSCRSFY